MGHSYLCAQVLVGLQRLTASLSSVYTIEAARIAMAMLLIEKVFIICCLQGGARLSLMPVTDDLCRIPWG